MYTLKFIFYFGLNFYTLISMFIGNEFKVDIT